MRTLAPGYAAGRDVSGPTGTGRDPSEGASSMISRVNKFKQDAETLWKHAGVRQGAWFDDIMRFRGLFRSCATAVALSTSIILVLSVALHFGQAQENAVAGLLVAIVAIALVGAAVRLRDSRKDLEKSLEQAGTQIFGLFIGYLSERLARQKAAAIRALGSNVNNIEEIKEEKRNFIIAITAWREMERAVRDVTYAWDDYRIEIKDQREKKMIGYPFVAFFVIAAAGSLAYFATEYVHAGWGKWIGLSALVAGSIVCWWCYFRWVVRKDLTLEFINDHLRLGTEIKDRRFPPKTFDGIVRWDWWLDTEDSTSDLADQYASRAKSRFNVVTNGSVRSQPAPQPQATSRFR